MASLRYLILDTKPLRTRGFRWLMFGQVGGLACRQFLVVIIPYEIFVETQSTLLVGLVGLIQVLPVLIFSLIGGVAADTYDRRSILIAMELLMALSAVGLALNSTTEAVWPIFLLAAFNAACASVESPARTSIVPTLISLDQLPSAFALDQSLSKTMQVVGPAVGGLVIAAAGIGPAYLIAAGAAVFAVFAIIPIGRTGHGEDRRQRGRGAIREALSFTRGVPVLGQILLIDLNAMVFAMPRALFPAIGTISLGGDAATVGLLYAAPGAGAMVAALTMGWVPMVRRQGRLIVLAVVAWGLAIAAFGLSSSLPVALALLAFAGAADVVSNVFRTTILQAAVPDRLRGRITSFKGALTSAGPRLGDAEAGAVAAATSPSVAIVSGGFLCVLGALLIAYLGRDIWVQRADDYDEPGVGHVGRPDSDT